MNLLLVRSWFTDESTIGTLAIDSKPFCLTLELPWKDNQHGVSCIPEGTYEVAIGWSPDHHMDVPHVLNVPDRDDIEMHVGNFPKDTKGCILVGASRGTGPDAIWNSGSTFKAFFAILRDAKDRIEITITKEAV